MKMGQGGTGIGVAIQGCTECNNAHMSHWWGRCLGKINTPEILVPQKNKYFGKYNLFWKCWKFSNILITSLAQNMCYTPCNTTPELWSTLPHGLSAFQNPYCVSTLSLNLNSVFRTPYARPSPTLPVPCSFSATLTEASVIPSWTYSSPCCTHDPA